MFFVVMRGDYRLDTVRGQTLEVAQESAPQPARSRVNRDAVIHNHQKVFAKEQGDQIAWQAIEHAKLKPAAQKIVAAAVCADKSQAVPADLTQDGAHA